MATSTTRSARAGSRFRQHHSGAEALIQVDGGRLAITLSQRQHPEPFVGDGEVALVVGAAGFGFGEAAADVEGLLVEASGVVALAERLVEVAEPLVGDGEVALVVGAAGFGFGPSAELLDHGHVGGDRPLRLTAGHERLGFVVAEQVSIGVGGREGAAHLAGERRQAQQARSGEVGRYRTADLGGVVPCLGVEEVPSRLDPIVQTALPQQPGTPEHPRTPCPLTPPLRVALPQGAGRPAVHPERLVQRRDERGRDARSDRRRRDGAAGIGVELVPLDRERRSGQVEHELAPLGVERAHQHVERGVGRTKLHGDLDRVAERPLDGQVDVLGLGELEQLSPDVVGRYPGSERGLEEFQDTRMAADQPEDEAQVLRVQPLERR
jgi:hypothetical protein